MKTEITFAQVAHLYLRSELKLLDNRIIDEGERNKWKSNLDFVYDVWKHNGNLRDNFTPIFQSFKNLIKSVKANKFVAELLGINEGDEYVMIEKIADIAYPSHENKK